MARDSRPVYSTDSGRLCPECALPVSNCQCKSKTRQTAQPSGGVTIGRERKGKAGKEVTVIRGLPLNALELQLLGSSLKKHCGSGGTVSGDTIEIQGDHREKVKAFLLDLGHQAKLAGG
jgi:translation initiation factor 1